MDRCCHIVIGLLAMIVVLAPISGAYRATSATTLQPPLLTSLSSTPASAAAANCLKHCVCKWKGGKESITCHQAAGLTSIPALGNGESTVQWLDLSGNAIGQLGAEQFRKVGLVHLQRIVLQRCSIRTIERTALWGLTNLVELDLSHNALTSIPSGALHYAPELRELKLNGNAILRLSDSVLVSGTKLVRLELANCQISQIDHKAFQVHIYLLMISRPSCFKLYESIVYLNDRVWRCWSGSVSMAI
jgi:Leucine-rich repeat (LRR) protein